MGFYNLFDQEKTENMRLLLVFLLASIFREGIKQADDLRRNTDSGIFKTLPSGFSFESPAAFYFATKGVSKMLHRGL